MDDHRFIVAFRDRRVDQVNHLTIFGTFHSRGIRSQVVDQFLGHIVRSEDKEFQTTIQLVCCFLTALVAHVFDIVAVQHRTLREGIGDTINANGHIAVKHTRDAFGIALGHETLGFDATRNQVIDHRLGTALRQSVVGEAQERTAVGMCTEFYNHIGVVDHDEIEVHQRIHEFLFQVPLGQIVANFRKDHWLFRHRFNAEVVDDILVCSVSAGAFRPFNGEVVDL